MHYNNNAYYFIPLSKISEKMIEDGQVGGRKSIRPISGELQTIMKYPDIDNQPEHMRGFRAYSHKEALEITKEKHEWNLIAPLLGLSDRYSLESVLANIDNGNIIQAVGEVYITIFKLLKVKFFQKNLEFLKEANKWKIFKSRNLEEPNESSILDLSYFYDVISIEVKTTIDEFRIIRNDITHDFNYDWSDEEIRSSIIKVDKLIKQYMMELMI